MLSHDQRKALLSKYLSSIHYVLNVADHGVSEIESCNEKDVEEYAYGAKHFFILFGYVVVKARGTFVEA